MSVESQFCKEVITPSSSSIIAFILNVAQTKLDELFVRKHAYFRCGHYMPPCNLHFFLSGMSRSKFWVAEIITLDR